MSYIYRLVEPSPDPARDEALLQTVLEIDHEGPKPHSLAINFKEVDRGVTPVSLAEEERDPDWRDKPVKERTALYWKEGKAVQITSLRHLICFPSHQPWSCTWIVICHEGFQVPPWCKM